MTKKIRTRTRALLVVVSAMLLAGIIGVQSANAMTPFGGLIYRVQVCTCSGNYAIYFNDLTKPTPISLPLIYQPGGTTLYQFYRVTTVGTWILGTWQPGGMCRVRAGKFCVIVPTAGTMYMVGTSR